MMLSRSSFAEVAVLWCTGKEMRRFIMARSTQLFSVVCLSISVFAGSALAVPLSTTVIDHDFTFDVPHYVNQASGDIGSAVYDFAGSGPDMLRLTDSNLQGEGPAGHHNVASYVYAGILPQVPPSIIGGPGVSVPPTASQWLYPLFFTTQYGAKLEIELLFDANDGPYTNGGDTFPISLTGKSGRLTITGWIGTQGFPTGVLYPSGAPQDITLLDIQFTKTSLLAREDNDTADLIEAEGQVITLLGQDISQFPELTQGATFFKFMLPDINGTIFPSTASPYDPMSDYQLDPVYGRISGEAGVTVPEPATMSLLGLGALAMIKRRRKR